MATRPKRTTDASRAAAAPTRTPPSDEQVAQWHARLLDDDERRQWFRDERGLSKATLAAARIGWNRSRYTVPVLDGDRSIVNVRRYAPDAESGQKMLHTPGCGKPTRWYRLPDLIGADPKALVLVCEGELDALLAQQKFDAAGVPVVAVSGTGGAGNPPADVEPFRGRAVAVLYDCDEAGRKGASKLAARLLGVAKSVRVVDLGMGESEDVTDWFADERSAADLLALIESADNYEPGGPRRSTDELLRVAVEEKCKASGSRNEAGFWLALQLRDERYTEAEAEPTMRAYIQAVTGLKPEPYTETEALASLASAYSRPPRDANGSREAGRDYEWDDIGNAQRLTDTHGPDMRYIAADGGWHVWDGRRWVADGTGRTMQWAKETARRIQQEARLLFEREPERGAAMLRFASTSASAGKLRAAMELAHSEPGITAGAAEFDADAGTLTVLNGTLLLGDTASLREHRREDHSRLLLPVDYDPAATAPQWQRFLDQAIPDEEVRQYVRRLAGYSLLGANPERRLVFIIGPSSTGKTTFLETLGKVLGDYATNFNLTLFRAKQDEGPRPDLVRALPKRFLFASEASGEWSLHADVIKQMTGEDTIKARGLHSNVFVARVPAFTPWIATNAAPRINAADPALWRRLVVVPFRAVADSEDVGLRARIVRDEAKGVLRWLVDGWNDYKRLGLDDMPNVMVEETIRLRESLSAVDAWLDDEADRDPAAETKFQDLWDAWFAWQLDSDLPKYERLSKMQLADALTARGFATFKRRVPGGGDNKANFRRGLSLREGSGGVRVTYSGGGRL